MERERQRARTRLRCSAESRSQAVRKTIRGARSRIDSSSGRVRCAVVAGRLAQQPRHSLAHHVVAVFQQRLGDLLHLLPEQSLVGSAQQRHGRGAAPPAVARARPDGEPPQPARVGDDHGADEVLHQRIVIGPGAHPVQPLIEEFEMRRGQIVHAGLQQQHGEDFFLQHVSVEEIVGHRDEVVEAFFACGLRG